MLGDGEEENNLKLLAKELSLEKRVHFLGQVKNPFQYMKYCEMFISSSSIEGFPNVLVEAMLCKTAVISSDCVSGPREILAPSTDSTKTILADIEMAEFGILYKVGDINGLEMAVNKFLENGDLKEAYIVKAFEQVKLYSVKNISIQYKLLF
jgi:N-acetylgalactosamine-N,N'-diacetylbacillosaminyl-diphospho-undecaprenol 4-alpha-N-acetylgalactosaminyltransferase